MDIAANINAPFEVHVERAGATGYQWQVMTLPEALEFLGSHSEPPPEGAGPGAPLQQVFEFVARDAGRYTLVLGLRRPWEAEPIQTLSATVEATP